MIQSGRSLKGVVWQGSTLDWGAGAYFTTRLGSYARSYEHLYTRQHWVRTVIDKRADLLARLPLKVYQRDDLNRPEADAHPYAELLQRPNLRMSRYEFWRTLQTMYDIYGETFGLKLRDNGGRPEQIALLHPTAMRIADEKQGGRLVWDFDNGSVQIKGIAEEDLIHPHTYNPTDAHRGLSKLESLRATLENEEAALRAQSAFWRNGARPGMALTHPGNISKSASDRLKLQWDEITKGVDNFGRTVVLEEGMRPEPMHITAEEAQYIDARKLNREEVVAGFDMPPPAVHILDHATYSNITEQMRSVYRDTVAPITTFYEAELEAHLRGSVRPGRTEPDFGSEVYAEFLLDGVLRGDFEQRMDAYQAGVNSGIYTPAEVRKLENLPFIEGSDQLFVNSTMIPMATASTPPEKPPADLQEVSEQPALRTVMGRLSRQKSLDDVDISELVAGLNGATLPVTRAYLAAKAAHTDLAGLRDLVQAYLAKEPPCLTSLPSPRPSAEDG